MLNTTKEQHYISRAELKLNGIDADSSFPRWICRFDVVDREAASPLGPAHKTGIRGSLRHADLFSFDVVDDSYRRNFEHSFGEYEHTVSQLSRALLEKLQAKDPNLNAEVVDLFAAKLLNFARNPYCIVKMLNTFGEVTGARPTDPELLAAVERVLSGNRRHRDSVCAKFGVTTELYDRWLHALFMLFARDPREPLNLFESVIKGLFESNLVFMHVFHFTDGDPQHVCLLSDRGFNQPFKDEEVGFAFEFNVSSRAFARLVFCDPVKHAERVPADMAALLRGQTTVCRVENDLQELVEYNQRTAYQCAKRVYAASSKPLMQLAREQEEK